VAHSVILPRESILASQDTQRGGAMNRRAALRQSVQIAYVSPSIVTQMRQCEGGPSLLHLPDEHRHMSYVGR
jgi:hypothetical protein